MEGTGRGYLGTSGAAPNPVQHQGAVCQRILFRRRPGVAGTAQQAWRADCPCLFGGAYGNFEQDLRGQSPSVVDFYNNQMAPAAIVGGHIDLNRSARWVFRVTPDAVMTRYSINYGNKITQIDVNFAISVGRRVQVQEEAVERARLLGKPRSRFHDQEHREARAPSPPAPGRRRLGDDPASFGNHQS